MKKKEPKITKNKITITFTHVDGEVMPSNIEIDSRSSIAEMYLALEAIHCHIHDAAKKLNEETTPMDFLVNSFGVAAQHEEE